LVFEQLAEGLKGNRIVHRSVRKELQGAPR